MMFDRFLRALVRVLVGVAGTGGVILAWMIGAHNTLLDFGLGMVDGVLQAMGVESPTVPLIADYAATAEQFIPVYFIFDLFLIYITLRVGWATYRFVKSWIPTVSSA